MATKKKISDMLRELSIDTDDQTLKIVNILEKDKVVPENKIAERLGLKINMVRKLLYRLNIKNLAVYTKKRDPKKKWWYLYYWSLDKDRIRELSAEHGRKLLAKKKEQFAAETCFAFGCKACDEKFTYEAALESDFSCPLCGGLLDEVKTNKTARKLQAEIGELEADIAKMHEGQVPEEKVSKKPKKLAKGIKKRQKSKR